MNVLIFSLVHCILKKHGALSFYFLILVFIYHYVVLTEAIKVDFEFKNPLQIPISVSDISLMCEHSARSEDITSGEVTFNFHIVFFLLSIDVNSS